MENIMSLKQLLVLAAVSGSLGAANVRAQNVPEKLFASSSDVAALIAKAKQEHKPGQALVPESLLSLAPYQATLEYRTGVGPAAVHVHQAEFLYVIEGSGTLVTGGKLNEEKQTNAENLVGSSIIGGTSRSLAAGDFIVVPENTPHWFSGIKDHLVLMSLHVPGHPPT
jgi:mannose-6-phosphate isomerase-like protein (cupin superfamily)